MTASPFNGSVPAGGTTPLALAWNNTSAVGYQSGVLGVTNTLNSADTSGGPYAQAVSGGVYRLASGVVGTLNIGYWHVGAAPVTSALTLTNAATNDYWSENLNASIGNPSSNFTAASSVSGIAPQASDSSSLTVTMATNVIHGSGTAAVTLYSDGTAVIIDSAGDTYNNGLGQTLLGTQTVNIVGGVYTGSGHWLGGNGNWGDITKWDSAGGTPGLAGPLSVGNDIAIFSSGGGTVSLSGNSPQIAALNFTSATATFTITSGNGSEWLQMVNTGGLNATINTVGTQTIAAQVELSSTVAATITNSERPVHYFRDGFGGRGADQVGCGDAVCQQQQ